MRRTYVLALAAGHVCLLLAACGGGDSPSGPGGKDGPTVTALTAGGLHSCRIAGGTTECWGSNAFGGLGDSSTTDRVSPVTPRGGLTFVRVAAGGGYSCALTGAGKAYCWGANYQGQIGNGTLATTQEIVPTAVVGGLTFASLSVGHAHVCGLTADGTAYCWGQNFSGELGADVTGDQASPVPVNTTLKFASISSFGRHTCALTAAGAAYCWGNDSRGQLGGGTVSLLREPPTKVLGNHVFTRLVGTYDSTCGLTASGAAFCWGINDVGQLGIGAADTSAHPVPEAVAGGVVFASLGDGLWNHLCGVSAAGVVYCWGFNTDAQVGDGTKTNRASPVAIGGALRFKVVSAGMFHGCAVTTTNATYCWGQNDAGQLGNGTTVDQPTPVQVVPAAGA